MIVLDEQISDPQLAEEIAAWYPGRVIVLKDLRPNSTVKDDAAATLLRKVQHPTFVTINVKHFWRVIRADTHFAVVNMALPLEETAKISNWLREYLRTSPFKTKAGRMGVIALLRPTRIEFYRADWKIETIEW